MHRRPDLGLHRGWLARCVSVLPAVYTWRPNSIRPGEELARLRYAVARNAGSDHGACRRASRGSEAIREDRGCVMTLSFARAMFNPPKTHRS